MNNTESYSNAALSSKFVT